MFSLNSSSSFLQKPTMDVDNAAQNEQQINYHEPQKQKQHSLPIELHCQIYEFLPLEVNAHCLLLNYKLSQLCIKMVRGQHQRWQQFRDNRLKFMFVRFHTGIVERIKTLEADCENFAFKEECFPALEKELDQVLQMNSKDEDLEIAQLTGPVPVLKFATRQKMIEHCLSCLFKLYKILERIKYRQEKYVSYYDSPFQSRIEENRNLCRPESFPSKSKEYNSRLDELKAKISAIERTRMKRLQKASWMKKLLEWDAKVHEQIQMMKKFYIITKKYTEDSFDPEKLLKELTDAKEAGSSKQLEENN